jgi:tetratricopeptide (TPR) repeat protein
MRLPALLAVLALALGDPISPSLSGQAAGRPNLLTPQERQRLEARALELFRAGTQARQMGDLAKAIDQIRESLQIREKLYPKAKYPKGHAGLADSLNAMGFALQEQGLYVEARGYLERALMMRQKLYPRSRYPHGHRDLAQSLNNLGFLLQVEGA